MKIRLSKLTTPQAMLVVGFVGMAVSVYLWYAHLMLAKVIGCVSGGGCDIVLASPYAKIFGVPIAAWGLAYYGVLSMIALFRIVDDRPLMRIVSWKISFLGIFFSAYFFYLELYKIHAICSWCKVSTFSTMILFILAFVEMKKFGGVSALFKELKTLYNNING